MGKIVAFFMSCFFALVVYGIVYFPAAPIRFREGHYLDKMGRECSREQYDRFHIWVRAFLVSWAVAATSMGIAVYRDKISEPRTGEGHSTP